jgi:hypothetical protein
MALKKKLFTPWSSLDNMLGKLPAWWPEEEQQRIAAYEKYDQMYWNDPTQYALRVLENEQPIYVPNARIVVDTTAQWLMKGFKLSADGGEANQKRLDDFLKREKFYSKFNLNKSAGITRGDSAFHVRADPNKPEGSRVSVDTLHPGMVWRVTDPDDPDKIIRVHIVEQYTLPDDPTKIRIRKLTYEKDEDPASTLIYREEGIYELEPKWYGPEPKLVKQLLKREPLDARITQIPVYWFPNIEWESQLYGSSELRGLEFLEWAVSQGATDTQMTLGLEGLGVFATDGGRPVDDAGNETDWEVSPGKVMEVPSGSYFRRVEGVGTITPMMDQLKYLESKMFSACRYDRCGDGSGRRAGGSERDRLWRSSSCPRSRRSNLETRHTPKSCSRCGTTWPLGSRSTRGLGCPTSRFTSTRSSCLVTESRSLNELNNMIDRKIISRKYYRSEAAKLGYEIPEGMDERDRRGG